MLPLPQKYAFLLFAALTLLWGARGFYFLFLRIRRGQPDPDSRLDHIPARLWYALTTSLTQSRTFRKRPWISFFHAFIFYGFVFYLLVNFVDAVEGYVPFHISSATTPGALYNLFADILSFLVLIGVIALVIRRFWLPARRDFRFNARTLLHPDVRRGYISLDSLIVSGFILFHVFSRSIGAGARLALEGPDPYQPFATLLSHLFSPQHAAAWRIFGYWGALGSVLLFLAYFPYTKHVHIFMAPAKYFFARRASSGVLPKLEISLEAEGESIGANKLEDLTWPRLLDAYACIQCNRCQDVCPGTVTGKSLSPSALEINKRMELNDLAAARSGFATGAASPRPLLEFALTPEAAWACTTCGACMQVCPVQDEQMLDIIDIRRHQVLMEGDFPAPLQTAFRGMERNRNPWGINHDKRLDWAHGLHVPTIEEVPAPDVLYWVGCAASYDPQAQKTARAVVQLLALAGIRFAVLGKKECCTGDTARRAGNELLYRQLADQNVETLNIVRPKLILTSCPHCMNTIGKEYSQIGGDYAVMHHTQYLQLLVADGKLTPERLDTSIAYHDPCYLGRHNGVYDAPREILSAVGQQLLELDRNRENAFCCGAGGAQFWKEEEPGDQRVSENRYAEATQRLSTATHSKTLAVGCPFCKSMLGSTPGNTGEDGIVIRDVAELLLASVQKQRGIVIAEPETQNTAEPVAAPVAVATAVAEPPVLTPIASPEPSIAAAVSVAPATTAPVERKKWAPAAKPAVPQPSAPAEEKPAEEKIIQTENSATPASQPVAPPMAPEPPAASAAPTEATSPARPKWQPKSKASAPPKDESELSH